MPFRRRRPEKIVPPFQQRSCVRVLRTPEELAEAVERAARHDRLAMARIGRRLQRRLPGTPLSAVASDRESLHPSVVCRLVDEPVGEGAHGDVLSDELGGSAVAADGEAAGAPPAEPDRDFENH